MSALQFSNDAFVEAVKKGGREREAAIRWLYLDQDLRAKVGAFVRNNQGNQEDGTDIFHEGILVLDRNIRENRFRGDAPVKGYFFSICRFLWMNRFRKQAKVSLMEPGAAPEQPDEDTPEGVFHREELKEVLRNVLNTLGEQCRKILEMWKLSYSMAEIAASLGMDNDAQARKAKYRCHLGLMQHLDNNPGIAQLLKQWL